jgi:hypothetical protein
MNIKKYTIYILATILVFGLGLGVGTQLTKNVEELVAEEVTMNQENEQTENPNILTNNDLGFELQIPQKWIDNNYYTKTIDVTSILDNSKTVGQEFIIMADFDDVEGHELIRVAKLEADYWKEINKAADMTTKYDEIVREQGSNINWKLIDNIFEQRYGYSMPEEYKGLGVLFSIQIGFSTFYEDSKFVYYITNYGHDAPTKYFEDRWHELYPADLRDMIKKI